MDFKTKPTSRKDLRAYAKVLRKLFNVPENGKFPVLEVLERLEDVFPNTNVEIVDDSKLNKKTMVHCFLNTLGGYTIEIKETVYNEAYYKNISYEESKKMTAKQIVGLEVVSGSTRMKAGTAQKMILNTLST